LARSASFSEQDFLEDDCFVVFDVACAEEKRHGARANAVQPVRLRVRSAPRGIASEIGSIASDHGRTNDEASPRAHLFLPEIKSRALLGDAARP